MQENVDIINAPDVPSQASNVVMDSQVVNQDPTLKSGKIKKIHLRNFMCHSNFEVHLNKNINVFVGLNGSGKSAVLSALTIGLGSKASSTARSTSLKDLVKQGEASATIEITLTNDGFDSFEGDITFTSNFFISIIIFLLILEDVYGKEITVVRNINANSGASTYKLKSAKGKVITTSRQDLNKLTMCLNIQVENPVLILNQDAARSFLRECDPKKMYILFLKATQIETIIEKLHACLTQAISSRSQLEHLERSIKQYESEVAVIKDKHERLQSVVRLRRVIVEHKNELAWLNVMKAEAKLTDSQNKLQQVRGQITEIQNMVKNKAKYDKDLKEKIRDLGTEFAGLSAVVNEKDEAATAQRDEFEKKKDELSTIDSNRRNLLTRKAVVDENALQLETDIAQRQNNPTNIENLRKENEAKVEMLEKKIDDLKLIMNTAQRDHGQFVETLGDQRERIENAKKQHSSTKTQFEICNQQIRHLESSRADALSAYGPSMSQLVKRLEDMHKKGKFKEMPRGPIGRYIEVPDKKFKQAVETILETVLLSFLVCCDKDRITLTQVFKEFPECSRASIITCAFQQTVYDVRNGMVRVNPNVGRVLMDVIKVSDPVVMNCLIDQRRIESIVLVDRTETAIELTQEFQDVPQNLSRVVLLKPMSEYYPAPNYRTYTIREKPSRYIQTSNKEIIVGIKAQKATFEEKLQQITGIIKQYQSSARDNEQLVQTKKKLINELQNKNRQYQSELDELKAVEYPPENEIEYLKQELDEHFKRQKQFMRKLNEITDKFNQDKAACTEMEEALKRCREEARAARDKMTSIQREIEKTQQKLLEMANDIKLKSNQLNDFIIEERATVQKSTEYDQEVQTLIAATVDQRVEVNRTAEEIQGKINSVEKRIRLIESHKENIEDVGALLESKVQQVEKMTKIRNVLEEVMKTVSQVNASLYSF